jgi:hypothetical protein
MTNEGWVELSSFTGAGSDIAANMLIAHLESEQIPARRFPLQTPATRLAGVMDQPIVVLVPEEHEAAARRVLTEKPFDAAQGQDVTDEQSATAGDATD